LNELTDSQMVYALCEYRARLMNRIIHGIHRGDHTHRDAEIFIEALTILANIEAKILIRGGLP
jgi:hypothetical protein